jgi:tetratricopeptide (TPR) repeat protein
LTDVATHPLPDGPRGRLVASRRFLAPLLLVALLAAAAGAWWWAGQRKAASPLEKGWIALGGNDLAAARRSLSELKAMPDSERQAALLRGAILLKKGFLYPAIDELNVAQSDAELRPRALTSIGEAWYRLGRHLEAQSALQQALELDPDNLDAHRWLAASYYDLGATQDAIRHLKRTAELAPTDQRPHRLLGLIYKDYERYQDAIVHYQESLRRNSDQPDWDQVRQELAACQIKNLQYREALATLETCAASQSVLVLRAECHYALGQSDAAKEALQGALGQAANNLEALLLWGTMLLEDSQTDEAINVLERAAQVAPQDYLAHFKLSQAYAQANRPELAAKERKTADYLRDVRKVFAELHTAAWDNPEDANIRLRLAQLAKELGRTDLEQMWLKSAAALQPLAEVPPPQN